MSRREYSISIVVNRKQINKVIIDSHYEEKHSESISDEIILQLVNELNGREFEPDDVDTPYSYFIADKIELNGKLYKLVWLLEDGQIYIGIVNAYRR